MVDTSYNHLVYDDKSDSSNIYAAIPTNTSWMAITECIFSRICHWFVKNTENTCTPTTPTVQFYVHLLTGPYNIDLQERVFKTVWLHWMAVDGLVNLVDYLNTVT